MSQVQQALRAEGVQSGDRVATLLPNGPEAIIVFLAAASIGAIYSSTSPDFGASGVVDRFGQIEPKVLIATDSYFYGGTKHDLVEKIEQIASKLPSLRKIVLVEYTGRASQSSTPGTISLQEWLAPFSPCALEFETFGFDQPVYVLYSSGTTGKPKCIVHRAGGVLLKHWSEHLLHCNLSLIHI